MLVLLHPVLKPRVKYSIIYPPLKRQRLSSEAEEVSRDYYM